MVHFSWFQLIPGIGDGSAFPFLGPEGAEQAYIVPTSWFVALVLIVLALLARRRLEQVKARGGVDALVPDRGLGARNLMEIFTISLFGLVRTMLPEKDARRYFPFIGTLFAYILLSNLLGELPGFLPPTDNMSNNLALALVVFVVFNVAGLARHGIRYITHMAGPVLLLAPLLFPIELISLFVRPMSLSLRLAGNMFGDHMVFGIMSSLVPVALPSAFLGLGMFVSFIQALVFTLLSVIYIALAVMPLDEH